MHYGCGRGRRSSGGICRDGCHIHLKRAPLKARDQTAFEREEDIDVCVGVQSAESLSVSCAAVGVPVVVPLREAPYGLEFYVRDPDGYVLGFVQRA